MSTRPLGQYLRIPWKTHSSRTHDPRHLQRHRSESDQGSLHPRRRGYVRAASGYLYNSLPTLSGSASLKSTPLKQQG